MSQGNSHLKLQTQGEDEVLLPAELAVCGLTTEEVGLIFSLYALATGTLSKEESLRITTARNQELIGSLQDRGILTLSVVPNGINISIDIENLPLPAEEEDDAFWDYFDFDSSDNAILVKTSRIGDEGSPFEYRFKPHLQNDTVQYTWAGDDELISDNDPREFSSEFEVMYWMVDKIQDEIDYIESLKGKGKQ